MGYFFLALALIAGAAKGFCGKKISSRLGGYGDAALSNFIRMIICVAVGFVLALSQSGNFFAETSLYTILCALLSGVATASFIVSWVISIRKGAFVMVDVFLTLGVGITLLLSRIFLNEHIRANHIIGFIILAVAAYVMCSYSQKLSGKMTFSSLLLLILCGVSNGLADFSQKLTPPKEKVRRRSISILTSFPPPFFLSHILSSKRRKRVLNRYLPHPTQKSFLST